MGPGSDDAVLRRVHPDQVVWDENLGRLRPSSGAFSAYEMSVSLQSALVDQGLPLTHALRDHPRHHLADLALSSVAELGLVVIPDPLPGDNAHANVLGTKTKSVRNQLAKRAGWAVLRLEWLDAELRQRHRG